MRLIFSWIFLGTILVWANEPAETLDAKQYLQIDFPDSVPSEFLEWAPENGTKLLLAADGTPQIQWQGKLREGASLRVNETAIQVDAEGSFIHESPLPLKPSVLQFKLTPPTGEEISFRVVYAWLRLPPSIRLKVKEDGAEKVLEKTAASPGNGKEGASVQLLAHGQPISEIDLDSAPYAELTFRVQTTSEDQNYDGWNFVLRNEKRQVVALLKEPGSPPSVIDWSQVRDALAVGQTYTYQLNLYREEFEFLGPEGKFTASEGRGLTQNEWTPNLVWTPRAEIGYFAFRNNNSFDISGSYLGLDFPVTYRQMYFLNLGATSALPNTDQLPGLTTLQAGLGLSLYGTRGSLAGISYLGKYDVSLRFTRYALPSGSPLPSVSLVGILLEPKWVLDGRSVFQPTLQIALGSGAMLGQLTLNYAVPIRKWSMRWGFGLGMESLFKYDADPSAKFTLFRMLTDLTFIL